MLLYEVRVSSDLKPDLKKKKKIVIAFLGWKEPKWGISSIMKNQWVENAQNWPKWFFYEKSCYEVYRPQLAENQVFQFLLNIEAESFSIFSFSQS